MTARQLVRLLERRHADAVFVSECKMGAAGSRSLDAWALLPTWSPLTAIGYEVKVSRSDWLQDQKFHAYLAVCHLFLVVAPKGVVVASELPPGVGLLEPVGAGDGMRLVMRVKPTRREPDAAQLVRLMAYALMWRTGKAADDSTARRLNAQQWADFASGRLEYRRLGRAVGKRLRGLIDEAQREAAAARATAERLTAADALMREMGITAGAWSVRGQIERALRQDRDAVRDSLTQARASLDAVLSRLDHGDAAERAAERSR